MPQGPQTKSTNSPGRHFIAGDLRLAISYWLLYLSGAALLFFAGSWAVDSDNWVVFSGLVAIQLAYTFVLILGFEVGIKGRRNGKSFLERLRSL